MKANYTVKQTEWTEDRQTDLLQVQKDKLAKIITNCNKKAKNSTRVT